MLELGNVVSRKLETPTMAIYLQNVPRDFTNTSNFEITTNAFDLTSMWLNAVFEIALVT